MNIISLLYNEVLFRPLFNLLVGVADILPAHNLGVAILVVTLIVRLILLPFSLHQARHAAHQQKKMTGLKAELKKINERFKDDATARSQATLELYRKTGINPAGGCLPLIIQLPILIALYRVFLSGLGPKTAHYLYSFVTLPTILSSNFFGINLTIPNLWLALLAGAAQFFQMRTMTAAPTTTPGADEKSAQMMASMQRNMAFMFPVMTVFITLRLPAALALYWVATTLFALIQQYILKRMLHASSPLPTV